jgi:tartrate dehydrogenase/decarboxylase/D-malate dehydrogenase
VGEGRAEGSEYTSLVGPPEDNPEDGSKGIRLPQATDVPAEVGAALDRAAGQEGTRGLVAVHRGEILDEVVAEVHADYPDVPFRSLLVDAAAMFMVRQPERFGVIVTTNLFGDILTDLGAALQGGMGLAAGANLDPSGKHPSMFEPIHGSAPDIAGRGIANPMATFWAISLMYDHLGQPAWARAVLDAVAACLSDGGARTPDLGGRDGTAAVGSAVIGRLRAPA